MFSPLSIKSFDLSPKSKNYARTREQFLDFGVRLKDLMDKGEFIDRDITETERKGSKEAWEKQQN